MQSGISPETKVEHLFPRLLPAQKSALKKLNLVTVKDLLYYFPSRYGNIADTKAIAELSDGDTVTIAGKISGLKASKGFRTKITMAEARVTDHTGSIKAIWFNQPYIAKMLEGVNHAKFHGHVAARKGVLYISNPEFEKLTNLPIDVGDSLFHAEHADLSFHYPVYGESRGVTSKWFYHATQKFLSDEILDKIPDPIPKEILERYHLPALKTALVWIHTPKKPGHAESARKRFAFQEIFFIQLARLSARKAYEREPSFVIPTNKKAIKKFVHRFPFEPTMAQQKAINHVLYDFAKGSPMTRLLEGDVGSGKTAVAATAAYAIVTTPPKDAPSSRLEVAYMAPTEILAKQHFESFIKYFKHLHINIGLITGSGCKKFPSKVSPNEATEIPRGELLKWVANGEIPILIGTHALIEKTVQFKNLALVIIDEQHRFGARQRFKLAQKKSGGNIPPHLLSMTATPIPRTLALTIYGDLDLTLLDQMPDGRKKIETEIVSPRERKNTYEKIRTEIARGRQCYVICPRINEPDPEKARPLYAKSVKEEAARLKKNIFPEHEIGMLHGKMTPKEKDSVMKKFSSGSVNILVATSVIEVGVNVPNATIIVIEGAERFGLAQLHQLRGRVQRSARQAYCYLFTDSQNDVTAKRLKALVMAKNGFELSEIDLTLRGAGALDGGKQWGISDLGMEAIKNIKMVEAARAEANTLLKKDQPLKNYPLLKEAASKIETTVHFE
jgi:ATP-dependent DNA helicase RecG